MSIRDELARIISEPRMHTNESLGKARAIATAILARYAVVELPEPEKDEWGNPDFSNEHIRLTVYSDGRTQLEIPEYFGVNAGVHPFQLRDLSARCLAAANRAEAQS